VAIAKQLTVRLENRPGALAELCTELAKVAVNIEAIQASETRPIGPIRLLVSHPDAAKKVFDRLGAKYSEEDVLAILIKNRPGSLGRLTRKLADKGINVEYLYATIGRSARPALIVLGVADVEAAARVVR
jgi:hypothetical protein